MGKLLSKIFGNKEMRILMLGLDAAGKTSIFFLPRERVIFRYQLVLSIGKHFSLILALLEWSTNVLFITCLLIQSSALNKVHAHCIYILLHAHV